MSMKTEFGHNLMSIMILIKSELTLEHVDVARKLPKIAVITQKVTQAI